MKVLRTAVSSLAHREVICVVTSVRRQVEVKDGDDGDEDAGDDDVDDVVQRLPLDDQVEGHFFVQVIVHVLPAWFMSDVPLSTLCQNI